MESPTGDTFAIRHACGAVGPSPRLWGIRVRGRPAMGLCRFIPTHVGNSRLQGGLRERREVHPHACGEYWTRAARLFLSAGSSPRMWGILNVRIIGKKRQRFIPTHVGNTFLSSPPSRWASVHPHACGEYGLKVIQISEPSGSSPRMWGIPARAPRNARETRFIPTHVGNTLMSYLSQEQSRGSSPRMWGIRNMKPGSKPEMRFIPTHVGNTTWAFITYPITKVHPHACGEYAMAKFQDKAGVGSSPRMWGIQSLLEWLGVAARFIPTHVGNTPSNSAMRARASVHPHACGEYCSASS